MRDLSADGSGQDVESLSRLDVGRPVRNGRGRHGHSLAIVWSRPSPQFRTGPDRIWKFARRIRWVVRLVLCGVKWRRSIVRSITFSLRRTRSRFAQAHICRLWRGKASSVYDKVIISITALHEHSHPLNDPEPDTETALSSRIGRRLTRHFVQ